MTDVLRDAKVQLAYLPRTLRLVWGAARGWTTAWAALLLVQGLLPIATVYLTGQLVDGLVAVVDTGGDWATVQPIVILALLMAGVLVLTELLQSVGNWVQTVQSDLIQEYISALVHKKSTSVDLAFYESWEYYDQLHRARDDAGSRPLALLESVGELLQNLVTLIAMSALLVQYGVWVPFVLLIGTLPALFVVLRSNWRYHQWWHRTTADRRWTEYYDWMLTDSDAAAEVRLFGLGPHFGSVFRDLNRRLRRDQLRLIKDQSLAQLAAAAGGLLISGAVLAWMGWRAIQGLVTLGDLALFYQAFQRGQSLMRSLLSNVGQIYTNSLFLSNLFAFLELKSQVVDPPDPTPAPATVKQGIRFREVAFAYPGSERMALRGFDLNIQAGQVVAIVGDNGAGKSTLVKLLCRFYDPQSGSIELDGVDLRDFAVDQLRRMVTVLFQWPVGYHATAGQNIALSDLSAAPETGAIEAAARGAGAHELIMGLPQGYETLLGKWFANGTDLSGGEWQRVALARAFLRRSPLLILDEPTSFMDSWAEAEWLDRVRTLVEGRTALIITNRFTTAMRADVIHMMRQGRIVESGSHEELLAQDGLYAQSWIAQMRGAGLAELEAPATASVVRSPYRRLP
jgi:ATP-binding cassette subfamily B protein